MDKKQKRGKRLSCKYIFVILLFGMLLLGALGQIVVKTSNLEVENIQKDCPEMTLADILNGNWQALFEEYFAEQIKIREYLIPVRNQIMYQLFSTSPNKNIVIGKNGNLYEEEYICYELQIYPAMTSAEVENLVYKLKLLKNLLEQKNKSLFIYITPSKARVYAEDIPEIYKMISPDVKEESTYSLFIDDLEESGIAYYDSTLDVIELKKNVAYDVFPKTGTHWSKVTQAVSAKRLGEELEKQLHIDLPQITIDFTVSEEPLHPDADLYKLLNLIEESGETYYAPIINIEDEQKEIYTLLARGGSFMGESIYSTLILNNYFEKSYYMENTFAISSEGIFNFNSYEELDLKAILEESDIVLLEVNEEAINRMSFGFVDYLLENNILDY